MRRSVSDSEKYAILGMHADGMSISQISSKMDMTSEWVSRTIHSAGKKPNRTGAKKIPMSIREEAAHLCCENGMSYAAASRALGISTRSVQTIVQEYKRKQEPEQLPLPEILSEIETASSEKTPYKQIIAGLQMIIDALIRLEEN